MSFVGDRLRELQASVEGSPDEEGSVVKARLKELQEEEAARREAFRKSEKGKPTLLRKVGEAQRGLARGVEGTAFGATDLVGDIWGGVTGKRPVFIPQKEDMRSQVPHSSGSELERASEFTGSMVFPWAGAGKTLASTMAKNSLSGGLYGAVTSEDSGLGRAVDSLQGAGMAGGTAGVLHGALRGIGKTSQGAKRLGNHLDDAPGDQRISGQLPLAQRVGDSPDLGSRLLGRGAVRRNKGSRAARAIDQSQRVTDDVYLAELKAAFSEAPHAWKAANRTFRATRDPKKAMSAGKRALKVPSDPHAEAMLSKTKQAWDDKLTEISNRQSAALSKKKLEVAEAKADMLNQHRNTLVAGKDAGRIPREGPGLQEFKAAQERVRREKSGVLASEVTAVGARHKVEKFANEQIAKREIAAAKEKVFPKASAAQAEARAVLSESLKSSKTPSKRFGPESAVDPRVKELMAPLRHPQATVGPGIKKPKKGSYPAAVSEVLLAIFGATSGNPLGYAVAGGAALDAARRARNQFHRHQFKAWKKANMQFSSDVEKLPALKNTRVQDALVGDTGLQKKMRAALEKGRIRTVEDILNDVLVRVSSDQSEDAE